VAVGVFVGVFVAVAVLVAVAVGVRVIVGVAVGVLVAVGVYVTVGVLVAVGVDVAVGVFVTVGVLVGVGVGWTTVTASELVLLLASVSFPIDTVPVSVTLGYAALVTFTVNAINAVLPGVRAPVYVHVKAGML
jgi:hypothetical protein